MSHEALERLAWERIDGTITNEDRELLDSILAGDPEARRRFDELCRLADELALADDLGPPSELRPRIHQALQAATPRWRRQATAPGTWKKQMVFISAGLLLGAVAGRLLIPAPTIDRESVAGAMVPLLERPADAVLVDLEEGLGSVALWREGTQWTAELTLLGDRPVEVVLDAKFVNLDLCSLAQSGALTSEVTEQPGRLVIRAEGSGRTVTIFSSDGTPENLHLTVIGDGRVLVERTVRMTEAGVFE